MHKVGAAGVLPCQCPHQDRRSEDKPPWLPVILLRGIRIEIHAVRAHPVDTFDAGVQGLAHSFMYEVERASEEELEAGSPPRGGVLIGRESVRRGPSKQV